MVFNINWAIQFMEGKKGKFLLGKKMNRIRWLSAGIVSESAFFRIPFFLLRYYVDQRMNQKKVYDS